MAAFRRCVIALAMLVVFAGLASAQASAPMPCTLNPVNNTIRNEGVTEQVGDILIVCTGGTNIPDGDTVPRLNFTVTLTTPVSSPTLKSITGPPAQAISDALLLVDEPKSGSSLAPGFGPEQASTPCATNAGPAGCSGTNIYKFTSPNGNGIPVMSSSSTAAVATAANVFQGVKGTNTITFYGIPVLAPVSTGVARVFRITNIRTDATGAAAASTVVASVSVSGTNASGLITPLSMTGTVATVQPGLNSTTTTAAPGSAVVCLNTTGAATPAPVLVGSITFGENFATAFKTRVTANAATAGMAQSAATNLQNIPGGAYAGGTSEDGMTLTGLEGTTVTTSGLAGFGTRLKAVFANIPVPASGKLFVSATNVINGDAAATPTGGIGSNATSRYAVLLPLSTTLLETTDSVTAGIGATLPTYTGSATVAGATTGTITVVPITVASGAATAVWEVTNTSGASSENFTFNIYVQYAANSAPTTGTGGTAPSPTASLSYAPTGTSTAALAAVPHFTVLNTATPKVFDLTACRTILLYPFVTSSNGYETGIAISNTSSDPFGTAAQAGVCRLYFYGTGAPSNNPPTATPSIAAGTTYAQVASAFAPGFQGYMFALCDFQYAHGFSFLSQAGNGFNGTMGYLPLVVPDPGTAARPAGAGATGETLNN